MDAIGDEFSISTTIQRDYFDPTLSEKDVDITFSIREAKTIKQTQNIISH